MSTSTAMQHESAFQTAARGIYEKCTGALRNNSVLQITGITLLPAAILPMLGAGIDLTQMNDHIATHGRQSWEALSAGIPYIDSFSTMAKSVISGDMLQRPGLMAFYGSFLAMPLPAIALAAKSAVAGIDKLLALRDQKVTSDKALPAAEDSKLAELDKRMDSLKASAEAYIARRGTPLGSLLPQGGSPMSSPAAASTAQVEQDWDHSPAPGR